MTNLLQKNIFKAYDIRGIVGDALTEGIVSLIGQSIGSEANDQKQTSICVGYDGRLSSPDLCDALTRGLLSTGIDVINIGLVTTPMLYFSTHELKTNTGIMITGSHNPPEYNGFKIVINAKPLSSEEIQDLYKRINIAETFSSDLAHEIRNPLASPVIVTLPVVNLNTVILFFLNRLTYNLQLMHFLQFHFSLFVPLMFQTLQNRLSIHSPVFFLPYSPCCYFTNEKEGRKCQTR